MCYYKELYIFHTGVILQNVLSLMLRCYHRYVFFHCWCYLAEWHLIPLQCYTSLGVTTHSFCFPIWCFYPECPVVPSQFCACCYCYHTKLRISYVYEILSCRSRICCHLCPMLSLLWYYHTYSSVFIIGVPLENVLSSLSNIILVTVLPYRVTCYMHDLHFWMN